MPQQPPPFSTSEYWDNRFDKNPSTFDWLLPPNSLDAPLVHALDSCESSKPKILHIGCGTSALSLHLRAHVVDPQQIHNVDFSEAAIDLGAKWEHQILQSNSQDEQPRRAEVAVHAQKQETKTIPHRMNWSVVDLLSLQSVKDLPMDGKHKYDVIVEKSTSDAIACGDDISIHLPYPLRCGSDLISPAFKKKAQVHPCHLLALHLALLSKPGTAWIIISYSSDRFPFLPPFPGLVEEGRLSQEILENGFPHPATLWRLLKKEQVETTEPTTERKEGSDVVHRPKVSHWLYILIRTDESLQLEH